MNGITDHPLMQALGLAVLHSVWQGILLFCILKMILALVPQTRAAARYRVLYLSFVAMTGLFGYSFYTEWQHSVAVWKYSGQPHVSAQAVDAVVSGDWQDSLFISYINAFRKYTPVLALLYTTGLLVLCFRMLRELLQVRYLRREVMHPESFLQERFITLKEQTGIRGQVLLRLSERVQVPLMLGHLKPIILLPLSLVSRLDAQQVEAILLHELAHIKRHDYFWNILQMVMETLLFFNPVAWWLSSLIREEREHCCDDHVLRTTRKSLPYAHTLLALEEYRISRYAATMAFAGNKKSSLLNRIKRITAMKQHKGNTQKILATVAVVVLLVATACFATAFGQDKKQEPKTVTKSYSKNVVTVTDDKGNTKVYKDESGDPALMEETMKMVPHALEMADKAIEGIDWDEINKTVEGAMAQASTAIEAVDWDEIGNTVSSSVNSAMKGVDWDEIQHSVEKAMKEAKVSMTEEEKKEFDRDMAEARRDMAEAKKEMAKAREEMKNIDWSEMQESIKQAKVEIKKAMKEAKSVSKEDMEKAKAEMKKALEEQRKAGEAGDADARVD